MNCNTNANFSVHTSEIHGLRWRKCSRGLLFGSMWAKGMMSSLESDLYLIKYLKEGVEKSQKLSTCLCMVIQHQWPFAVWPGLCFFDFTHSSISGFKVGFVLWEGFKEELPSYLPSFLPLGHYKTRITSMVHSVSKRKKRFVLGAQTYCSVLHQSKWLSHTKFWLYPTFFSFSIWPII